MASETGDSGAHLGRKARRPNDLPADGLGVATGSQTLPSGAREKGQRVRGSTRGVKRRGPAPPPVRDRSDRSIDATRGDRLPYTVSSAAGSAARRPTPPFGGLEP